uniref:Uncharacterized protein n=1 Tax=Arundo donax TaxID=35708 RepID=A0A0A9GB34_ARUDO
MDEDDAGESLLGDGEGLGDAGRLESNLPDRERHGIGDGSTVSSRAPAAESWEPRRGRARCSPPSALASHDGCGFSARTGSDSGACASAAWPLRPPPQFATTTTGSSGRCRALLDRTLARPPPPPSSSPPGGLSGTTSSSNGPSQSRNIRETYLASATGLPSFSAATPPAPRPSSALFLRLNSP